MRDNVHLGKHFEKFFVESKSYFIISLNKRKDTERYRRDRESIFKRLFVKPESG